MQNVHNRAPLGCRTPTAGAEEVFEAEGAELHSTAMAADVLLEPFAALEGRVGAVKVCSEVEGQVAQSAAAAADVGHQLALGLEDRVHKHDGIHTRCRVEKLTSTTRCLLYMCSSDLII